MRVEGETEKTQRAVPPSRTVLMAFVLPEMKRTCHTPDLTAVSLSQAWFHTHHKPFQVN